MTQKYGIFGAVNKEPPQLTTARSILGVGRDANEGQIKREYYKYALQWHPDKNPGKKEEATQKMALYTSAYDLLTDSHERKKAEVAFDQALRQPFLIGNRVFCLGSLYGVRIYIPQGQTAVTDTRRILTGEVSTRSYTLQQHYTVYGIRDSILEDQIADLLYTFYGGSNVEELAKGFHNREAGGLDDLPWIRNNDRAVDHFLNRRFKQAAYRMKEAGRSCPNNVILMYREGVCLEAFAAELKTQNQRWKPLVNTAVDLYQQSLCIVEGRKVWEEREYMGKKQEMMVHKPEAQLTILMQLADAQSELGNYRESKKLWARIKQIDPNCYEAREKTRNFLLALPVRTIRVFGLLKK